MSSIECKVINCDTNKLKHQDPSIKFYRMPRDVYFQKIWIEKCGLQNVAQKYDFYVCSVHFTEDDFVLNYCCRGNYSPKDKVHSFSFPKNEALKLKWLKAVGRRNFKPARHSSVCHKHFKESDIIQEIYKVANTAGEIVTFHNRVKLKVDAVPSIDLNNPYLQIEEISKPGTKKRRLSKTVIPKSEPNSSEDDIPLETIRNQISESPDKGDDSESHMKSDKVLKKKFKKLLEDYELLKKKSVGLDQEIKVLELVNLELKCNIFKD